MSTMGTTPFQCPICGCDRYAEIEDEVVTNVSSTPEGHFENVEKTTLITCVCAGCSVMFTDAESFTKFPKRNT